MTDTELVKPCPFCGWEMVEAQGLATRRTTTFTHAEEAPESCPARGVLLVIGEGSFVAEGSELRLEYWNDALRPIDVKPKRAQDMEPVGYRWRQPTGYIVAAFEPEAIATARENNGEPSQKLYDEGQMERVVMAQIDRQALVDGLHDELAEALWEQVEAIADRLIERMRP